MNLFATVFYDWSRVVAGYFAWAGPLAARIVVGWVFLWSGWTKLHILPRMIENFRGWGIPAPEVLAPFASGMEFVGGLLLLAGLLTRFIAVPMMIIMIVAIASAKWADVDSLETLLGFDEVAYFVMFAHLGPRARLARSPDAARAAATRQAGGIRSIEASPDPRPAARRSPAARTAPASGCRAAARSRS